MCCFLYLVIISFILEAHLHLSFYIVLMTLIGFIFYFLLVLLELHSCPWVSFEVLKLEINNNKSTGKIFKENTLYPPSSVCSSSGL